MHGIHVQINRNNILKKLLHLAGRKFPTIPGQVHLSCVEKSDQIHYLWINVGSVEGVAFEVYTTEVGSHRYCILSQRQIQEECERDLFCRFITLKPRFILILIKV